MANSQIWGNLAKAVNDNTTIDSAIATAVQAHGDSPEAHLAVDQALQSHAAAEIIDHRAESIVNDKLATTARRYVAIVDPNSISDFATVAGAVAYAIGKGGGDIFITRGVHYLAANVKTIPTIGLYGNGIGETILQSDTAVTRSFNFYSSIAVADGYPILFPPSIGQSTFVYDPTPDLAPDPVPGMFLVFYDVTTLYFEVLAYDTITNIVTIDGVIPTFVGEADLNFCAGAALVNGTSTAQVFGNKNMLIEGYFPGMSIKNASTNADYKTISADANNIVTLSIPFTGTTAHVPIFTKYTGVTTFNASGIEFNSISAPVGFNGYPGNSTAYIEQCKNVILSYNSTVNQQCTYIMCTFDANATAPLSLSNNSTWLNCKWIATENGSVGLQISGQGLVQGCQFLANGFTNHKWFYGAAHPCLIIGNTFESFIGAVIFNTSGNSIALGMKIADNTFTFEANQILTFQCINSIFTGNKFTFIGTGALAFNAGAKYNLIANNHIIGAITDIGVGNMIINNTDANHSMYYILATASTACDMFNNEVVYHNPTATKTLTTTVPRKGEYRLIILHQSNTTAITITFGTGFRTVGTLALGITLGRKFQVSFISNGTELIETGRSGAVVA